MGKTNDHKKSYVCTIKDHADIRFAQDALYVISGKWRIPIIIALHNGIQHYRDLHRSIPGITFSMLSRELKLMALNNLVVRLEDPDFPKQVEYRLTAYCQSLYPLVEQLVIWGKQHREIIRTYI